MVEHAARGAFLRRQARVVVTSAALVAGLVWIMTRGALPILPPAGTLERVETSGVIACTAYLVVHMLTRFARCHFLLAPIANLKLVRLMSINAISLALITFLPLRLGEAARPVMLREKGKLSAWAVAGTVAAERVIDGVVFSAILLIGLALPHGPLENRIGDLPIQVSLVPNVARLASVGFAGLFCVMVLFYWRRATARRLTERILGIVSERFAKRAADVVEHLSEGLRFLANPMFGVAYVAITVLSIVANILAIVALAGAVGLPQITFLQAMVVLGLLALGFAAPNAPGFFGSVQLALYAGLALYLPPETVVHEGAVLVFLFYLVYLAVVVALAGVGLAVEFRAAAADELGGASSR